MELGGVDYLVNARDGLAYFYDVNALSNFVANAADSSTNTKPPREFANLSQVAVRDRVQADPIPRRSGAPSVEARE
jgi:hypothetical protein